jgi:Na+/citrate or Na+/malate symporter
MAVRLSALRVGRALLPIYFFFLFLILVSVKRHSNPRGLVLLEGLGKLEKFSDLIGSRTPDLPAYRVEATLLVSHTGL